MKRKSIKELTEDEAREILNYVYPDKDYWFEGLHYDSKVEKDGSRQVTFGLRPLIGIGYRNDLGDRCMIHFDNTKVVLWLYKNGYDIEEQLEENKYMTQMEYDFENLAFAITWHCESKPNHLKEEGKEDTYTLEKTREILLKAVNKYYYDTEY